MTSSFFCFICKRRAGGQRGRTPCYFCSRAVADAILEREPAWISARWSVTPEFGEAREMALVRERPRSPVGLEGAARGDAGLARGYVDLGLRGAALVTAALALGSGAVLEESAEDGAAEIVFASGLLSELGKKLIEEEFG